LTIWPTTAPVHAGSQIWAWTRTSAEPGPTFVFGAWPVMRVTISSLETGVPSGMLVELPR
jgi:hypothetical protein